MIIGPPPKFHGTRDILPFALEDITLHSSVSIGMALFPDDGPDLSSLLRKADIALRRLRAG